MRYVGSAAKVLTLVALSILSLGSASRQTQKPPACMISTAKASWYAGNFIGRRTANGEIYTAREMTAAHKTLPFGTRLKVTNPENGKSVTVTINDRGPYIKGRSLDLSLAAAEKLGMVEKGVAVLIVESCTQNQPPPAIIRTIASVF